MEVILKKDVKSIGKSGQVVRVKEGFARNFLFPQSLAQIATPAALKEIEKENLKRKAELEAAKQESIKLQERLGQITLTISALTQNQDKLYGSIHAADICAALETHGLSVDKNLLDLPEAIKSLGLYNIQIKLHPEVTALVKLQVIKK